MAAIDLKGRAAVAARLLPLWFLAGAAQAQPFQLAVERPTLDRFVYAFSDFVGDRLNAPSFASFDSRFDTRDGQLLLGWDTATLISTNAGPSKYLIKKLVVTLNVDSKGTFTYDPSHDAFQTYLDASDPAYVPDSDEGTPVELFAAGYRNGWTAESFKENSPYGFVGDIRGTNVSIRTRNVFAADFGSDGNLRDISNNVGVQETPSEVTPFAVGQTTDVAPGEVVPVDSNFTFEINLADPLIAGYVQQSLNEGHLRLVSSSLHRTKQLGGTGTYPSWATKETILGTPPKLQIEGVVVRAEDSDHDGLPDDWEIFYFGDLGQAAGGDPDADGASNLQEYQAGTNPALRNDALRIIAIHTGAPDVTVRFTTSPSRHFEIQQSSNLTDWTSAPGAIRFLGGGEAEWTGQTEAATSFLRVQAR